MKLFNNRSLVRLQILNVILIIILFGMMWVLEGCTLEVDTEPIQVEVPTIEINVVQDMDCDQFDLVQYLTYPICTDYNREDCCNMRWSQVCMISFCDGCIGLDDGCLSDIEEGDWDAKGN
jgi:hypothetical protein